MLALVTDFGWNGPYTGQMRAVLARHAPREAVVDLLHDAPRFAPVAAGHLLAALTPDLPVGSIVVGVIDPGVGTERAPIIVRADERWYVGPANGLFDVVAARAADAAWWRITRAPLADSATFHGRDLFAPAAADLARGELPGEPIEAPLRAGAGDAYGGVIYIDDFGNAMTGLRPPEPAGGSLRVAGEIVGGGRTFADAARGEALWLINSLGLVEIAVNQGSAAQRFGIGIGAPVEWAG